MSGVTFASPFELVFHTPMNGSPPTFISWEICEPSETGASCLRC